MAAEERLIDVPFRVHQHEHGLRVDTFLSRRVTRMSRSLIAKLVRIGHIRKEPGGVFDKPSAKTMGLKKDKVCVMIHSGSRGLGYQVCDDAACYEPTGSVLGVEIVEKE